MRWILRHYRRRVIAERSRSMKWGALSLHLITKSRVGTDRLLGDAILPPDQLLVVLVLTSTGLGSYSYILDPRLGRSCCRLINGRLSRTTLRRDITLVFVAIDTRRSPFRVLLFWPLHCGHSIASAGRAGGLTGWLAD